MKKKNPQKKLLATWVKVTNRDLPTYNKTGVVMDDDFLHNGVICCRVIINKDVHCIEAQYLQPITV